MASWTFSWLLIGLPLFLFVLSNLQCIHSSTHSAHPSVFDPTCWSIRHLIHRHSAWRSIAVTNSSVSLPLSHSDLVSFRYTMLWSLRRSYEFESLRYFTVCIFGCWYQEKFSKISQQTAVTEPSQEWTLFAFVAALSCEKLRPEISSS